MNQQQGPETEFERRLGAELTAIVAGRGAEQAEARATTPRPLWRRTGPRIGLAGAAVAGVAVVALIVSAGGGDTPAAYAVEAQPEGMVSVEIRNLEDAKGLEQALEEVGIPASVNYLAAGMTCKEPRFRSVPWPERARAMTQAKINPGSEHVEVPNGGGPPFAVSGPLIYSISRDAVGPNQTLVFTASASASGLFEHNRVEIAEGTVAPCEPVPAPAPGNKGGDGG
jgi:hypothetical protein